MPLRSKVAGTIASMVASDSEPDFDDVEAIGIHTARETHRKVTASKRSRDRPTNSTNRVVKPGQRSERQTGGIADSSRVMAARQILVEKSHNTYISSTSKDRSGLRKPEDKVHEISSVISRDQDRPSSSRRTQESEHARHQGHSYDNKRAGDQYLDSMEVDEEPDSIVSIAKHDKESVGPEAEHVRTSHEKDVSEASVRRRLGELSQRYDSLEERHKELRDVGVKAAERNFERLKMQLDENTAASNKLIYELKAELASQSTKLKESEQVSQQLESSMANVGELEKRISDLTASLSHARSEIKSLSTKLTASRAAEAGMKVPGSALKPGIAGSKSTPSEVVLAAQAKEDLYGDLTGLIIRGMNRNEGEDVFDCIQTGRNGTLHFKLALETGDDSENYNEVQFTYRPQLNSDRDGDLMEVLPDYLVEEITFPRTQAARFYSRVSKSLTERLD